MALEVLSVDDETDIRDLVAGVLEDDGYQTRGAANSDEALAALSERPPSLVLLDVWLSGSTLFCLVLLFAIYLPLPSLPFFFISFLCNFLLSFVSSFFSAFFFSFFFFF